MKTLNLELRDGYQYCAVCLAQIPATFLACPACHGLVQEHGHWVAPSPAPKPPRPDEEQPLLFDAGTPEYPV